MRDETRSFWERRNQPESPRPPQAPPARCFGETRPRSPATHFLLPGFSLFSPPFELFEGDFAFQVVDKLRAEPRHVGGGRRWVADRESGNTRAPPGAMERRVRSRKLPGPRRGRALGFRRRSRPRASSGWQR